MVFSLSSWGYCKKHGGLLREDPTPNVNIKYINIKGKENNNSYNIDETHKDYLI